MPFDATNRKDIRAREKEVNERHLTHIKFLGASMDTPEGRLYFHDLLVNCAVGVDIPSFEPNRDYFTSGRRSIGLQIKALLETHCPDQYLQMMREEHARIAAATERSRFTDARRNASEPGSVREPGPDWDRPDPYAASDDGDTK